MNLRIPGPTPCPPEVLAAVGRQVINHRSPEMAALQNAVTEKFRSFLGIDHEVYFLAASGTGGLEAAVVNALSPGDRVLGVDGGAFGDRFCAIAETFGAEVTRLPVEWGRVIEAKDLGTALDAQTGVRAVLLTHNETSTGVTYPIEELCRVIREQTDALILVDAVSSLGAIPLPAELGVDIVITGSQKAWAVPPGLVVLAFSERAWEASDRATMPRFYFDLRRYRESAKKGQAPFTPPLSLLYGLDVALDLMLKEGREATYARHARLAARARTGVRELGLRLFADERYVSNTVTAIALPEAVDGKELARRLREDYDTVIGGGQGKLAGRIVRLGHMGWVSEEDVDAALEALRRALKDMGHRMTAQENA